MTKVSWAEIVFLFASNADFVVFNYAKAGVKETIGCGLVSIKGIWLGYLCGRLSNDLFRTEDSELNTNNFVKFVVSEFFIE
jgi:hypothetical protein